MPKMKTHSGAKKRFKKTAKGKLLARHSFTSHNLGKKSAKRKRIGTGGATPMTNSGVGMAPGGLSSNRSGCLRTKRRTTSPIHNRGS